MDDDVTLPPHPPTTPTGEPAPDARSALATVDPHVVASEHLANLRDIGGRATADGGTVRRGVAFRSAELRAPTIADDPVLAGLGVRTVVDLRTAAERAALPDVLPAGARGIHADVLAVTQDAPAADFAEMLRRPDEASRVLAELDPAAQMRRTYVDLVVGDLGRAGYATLLRQIIDPPATPVLYHCTAGKDRTGWATTVLLLTAGVDEDGVREEYLGVNAAVDAMYAPLLRQFASVGGDPALLVPLLQVHEEYLDAALDAMRTHFGTVDDYLRDGLRLTDEEVAALRATLVA
ncbi:tyrosine-protein phosphatase [Cellulomonas xiejunii]|uniref:tyrosine-protein phosphatase n=1 Tax=Cellulomonas xiejunii TaxID=2968083 RepID=UPI001D0F1CF8|nr:tyrosine-protein phosphatase [Cellulomonas xiejunii]MCC2314330.1 tyrosine-protein phosphatase [Cellulomonas xiejunii]